MKSSHFLVTGAGGFVGRALSTELVRRGYDAFGVVRKMAQTDHLSGGVIEIGEINAQTDWKTALEHIDIVVHLAARVHVMRETDADPLAAFRAVNVAGTERLARLAAGAGVRRFLYVSSIGVHGNCSGKEPISEASAYAPYDAYSVSKLEAERVLFSLARETGLEVAVVRPPLVYGPNNPGNLLRLLKLVRRGLPLPLASVHNRRSMIYLGNLVDALITCAIHPHAAGQAYIVADGTDLSTPQLIRTLAQLMGKSAPLWPCPPALLRWGGMSVGKLREVERLVSSLEADSGKIRHDLGWVPPFSIEEGLADTVRWFQGCP